MKKLAVAAILICLVSSRAFAAGMTAHMFMSEKAMEQVSDPQLKALLKSHSNAVMAGSVFPDTGNGLDYVFLPGYDNYSSEAHRLEFLAAYGAYVNSSCRQPYSDHCQLLVAHYLGTCAHVVRTGYSVENLAPDFHVVCGAAQSGRLAHGP